VFVCWGGAALVVVLVVCGGRVVWVCVPLKSMLVWEVMLEITQCFVPKAQQKLGPCGNFYADPNNS